MAVSNFRVIGVFILTLLLSPPSFAFDMVEILTNAVHVTRSGFLTTDQELSPQAVLLMAQQGQLMPLPKKGKSFGFDQETYWFYFETSTQYTEEPLFLDLKNYSASSVDLFVFDAENQQLLMHKHSSDTIPIEKRDIKTLAIRFKLADNAIHAHYLLKVHSINPHFTGFSFGTYDQVNQYWQQNYIIFFISVGVLLSLVIYNLFIFISTRDSAYLYYSIYMVTLFVFAISAKYSYYLSNVIVINYYYISSVLNFIALYSLIMFSIKFLSIEDKKTIKQLYGLILFNLIASVLYAFSIIIDLFLLSIVISIFSILYLSAKEYLQHNKVAIYFMISTGVGIILLLLNILVIQGMISYNILTSNLWFFAADWDLITLSLALAYRIRTLQEDNKQKENMILMQSRQNQIGELSGNIAHQWRRPLTEIGAIMTNLEAKLIYGSAPNKAEILAKVSQSMAILRHLSDTVTTFQSFFQKHHNATEFKVIDTIGKTLDFVDESMKNNQITIQYHHSDHDITLLGDANALSQALLSILLNAKDALLDRQIINPTIHIEIIHQNGRLFIHICDNAGGINIRPIESIFDSYVTDKAQGTGIGLFITRSIIEKSFNGQVSAKNSKQGACFEISIAC